MRKLAPPDLLVLGTLGMPRSVDFDYWGLFGPEVEFFDFIIELGLFLDVNLLWMNDFEV